MRRFTTAVVWLATAFLLLGPGCSSDESDPTGVTGNGGGGGGGGGGTAYELSPWSVERYGADLYGIAGHALTPTLAGEKGVVFQGAPLHVLPTATTRRLNDAWFSTLRTFVVGDRSDSEPGLILRYQDGKRYDLSDALVSGDVTAVDAIGDNDVYMSTSGGQVLRYRDGALAEVYSTDPLYDISVTTGGAIYAAGQGGVHVRSAGSWSRSLDRPGLRFDGVSAVSPDSVLAVGGEQIWLFDGTGWDNAWTAGEDLRDVGWLTPGWAVAVGLEGTAAIFDGSGWSEDSHYPWQDLHAVNVSSFLGSLAAVAAGNSGTTMLKVPGEEWIANTSPKTPWTDLAGTGGGDVFGILGGRLMHHDGNYWVPGLVAEGLELTDLWVVDANHIWAAGKDAGIDNFAGLYSDGSWEMRWMSSMDPPRDLWAAGLHNAFVASDYGTVYHYGEGWIPASAVQPPQHLKGIWGVAMNHVYVVGENGTICKWDGTYWTPMTSGTQVHLNAIHGSSSNNIVAVGNGGVVLRYDGDGWIVLHSGTTYDLIMVWTGGPGNIWAASADGGVVHYNGTSYEKMTTNLPQIRHNAIWGTGSSDVRIGCEDDFMLRYLGS
jgi:hypothetical protein